MAQSLPKVLVVRLRNGQEDATTLLQVLNLNREVTEQKHVQQLFNKAGYTAISCGRVGRGGNARFSTFRLVDTDGRTDKGS